MAGIPIWGTLVGLVVAGRPVVGVANAPALDELYDGALGLGARLNGTKIEVDPIRDLAEATLIFASAESWDEARAGDFFRSLTRRTYRSRGFGDFWGHMLVARGAAHVCIEPRLNAWDYAAPACIVAEAGGMATHLDGATWSGHGSALTSCGSLHDLVTALFDEMAPGFEEPVHREWDL
jgi:histidinol-phosphatase